MIELNVPVQRGTERRVRKFAWLPVTLCAGSTEEPELKILGTCWLEHYESVQVYFDNRYDGRLRWREAARVPIGTPLADAKVQRPFDATLSARRGQTKELEPQ